MKKKTLFIFLAILLLLSIYSCSDDGSGNTSSASSSSSSSASTPDYFCLPFGGTAEEHATGTTLDSAGNLYIVGHFEGSADFDPTEGTDIHTSNGSFDIFITKIDANGTYGWTKTFGGTGYDTARDIEIDNNGYIYVTGTFIGSVDFNPSTGTDTHTAIGSADLFLTKIDPNGSYGWTKTFGGTGSGTDATLIIDKDNNIYLTGSFSTTVDFDPSSSVSNITANGGTDIFITRINANGTYEWTKTVGSTGIDCTLNSTIDNSGNIYMTGFFDNTVDFDPGTGIDEHTAYGWSTIFITKLNINSTYSWTKKIKPPATDVTRSTTIAVDSLGNIYTAGYFVNTTDFNPEAGGDSRTASGGSDIFITKINANGTYGWTKTIGSDGLDGAYSIALDNIDNIYITGYFNNTVDFDPSTGVDNHTSNGGNDIFITKINANGTYGWTKTFGGTGDDCGNNISINNAGHIWVTGTFKNSVTFGSNTHTSTGGADIFLLKISNH